MLNTLSLLLGAQCSQKFDCCHLHICVFIIWIPLSDQRTPGSLVLSLTEWTFPTPGLFGGQHFLRDVVLESNEPIESPISLPIGTKRNFICKRTNYRSMSQIFLIDSPKIFNSPTGTCGDKISDTERMKSLEGSVKIKQETSGHLKVLLGHHLFSCFYCNCMESLSFHQARWSIEAINNPLCSIIYVNNIYTYIYICICDRIHWINHCCQTPRVKQGLNYSHSWIL